MINLIKSWFQNRTFGVARSPKWREVRQEHLKIQDKCQACMTKKNLEVHHEKVFHIHPELELEPSNLLTLCSSCHLLFGHLMDYSSWNDQVRQDCLVMRSKILNRPD